MNDGIKMPWGKHKGKWLNALPSGYLKWLAENCDWNMEIQLAADEEYQWRTHYNAHPPDGNEEEHWHWED
jgi:hypothetical protein